MSSVITLRAERAREAGDEARPRLGPAEVLAVFPHELEVRLKTGAVSRAQLALGYPYDARRGDTVLVIADVDGCYVIGVLAGTGRTVFEVPGDVEIRAVDGALRLSGDKGVEIVAPELAVRVGRFELFAEAAVERFASLVQKVADLWSVQAGERHTVIEGSSHEQAKSISLLTEEETTINGKAIYLG